MSNILRSLTLFVIVATVSCVTINIYFPAEELRGAADRIVDEVYGEKPGPAEKVPVTPPGSSFLPSLGVSNAYAAQDIDVSTPEIRALRADMKDRFDQLAPSLDSGHVGIDASGYLELRSTDGLGLKQRAEIKRLVDAENQDRKRLYQEIAKANGLPDKVNEIEAIFSESWRDKAAKGWYLQDAKGNWSQK
jgi:uncharacterized protein YdbL (DUF1318 family)